MTKYCYKLAMILLMSAGFAVAQGSNMPKQNPSPNNPDAMPVQPSPAQPLPAQPQKDPAASADVQTKIQSALQADPLLSSVSVNVTDSSVTLSGTVATQAAKTSAGDIAKANAGNRKVTNSIKVNAGAGAEATPPKQ